MYIYIYMRSESREISGLGPSRFPSSKGTYYILYNTIYVWISSARQDPGWRLRTSSRGRREGKTYYSLLFFFVISLFYSFVILFYFIFYLSYVFYFCGHREGKTLPGRLELPTLRLTASRSNQLS